MQVCQSARAGIQPLFLQILQLSFSPIPFLCLGKRVFLRGDCRPGSCQFCIDSEKLLLSRRQVRLGKDRFSRTLRHAYVAINAFVRIDHQKIRPLVKAVHRANSRTVGVFAENAVFGHYISHFSYPRPRPFKNSRLSYKWDIEELVFYLNIRFCWGRQAGLGRGSNVVTR